MAKGNRFDGVDFSLEVITEATPPLMQTLGEGFRCLRGEFVTFWKKGRISRECQAYLSRCWIICHEGYLAGYVTLLADKLTLSEPELAGEGVNYKTFPAVKIGLLAADKRAKKAGTRLVEWAMEYAAIDLARRLGIRFMTVDAFYDKDTGYDASGFYERLGFRFVNPEETLPPPESYRTMYFDLKPLIDLLNESGQEVDS